MRSTLAKFLSPTIDLVEHSTVIAIGIQFMCEHWTNLVVVSVVIIYIVLHRVTRVQASTKEA